MPKLSKKVIHLCIILVIIVAIIFTALIIVLKYGEDGETNMPFSISKIVIISTVDAKDVENKNENWNLQVNQNNDVYIYIEKNNGYKKTETIDNININNINIVNKPNKGSIKIYKPSSENTVLMFENIEKYQSTDIQYKGEKTTDMKNLKISNQGGILTFRCSNDNLGAYISNEGKEVEYSDLLKKIGVNNDDLKATVSFDIVIGLNSGKSFKATYNIDVPVEDIVSNGETSMEITDFKDVIFKRIEN
ncbi:MAG: hypothetical protein HFJ17_04150 [Clostridia bacterium]|nr:hypothetical protein [Clostridia bacterium]